MTKMKLSAVVDISNSGHHEDAGGHHRRRVDQRGDRRRAFHRVRQPDVQRHLRGLAHRADEQADADHRRHRPFLARQHGNGQVAHHPGVGERSGVVQGPDPVEHAGDAEQEAEIADAVDQERLEVGEDRRRLLVPEADQQVGHQAHRFPAEEQLQEVVAHHQHQHAEGEQRDVAEETLVAVVLVHVADGVDVHQQRDEGDHHHHHRGQLVDHEADVRRIVAHLEPGVEVLVERRRALQQLPQHVRGQHAAGGHAEDGHAVRAHAADPASEQAGEDAADQRQQHDQHELGLG
jgi:hypothetical protein